MPVTVKPLNAASRELKTVHVILAVPQAARFCSWFSHGKNVLLDVATQTTAWSLFQFNLLLVVR